MWEKKISIHIVMLLSLAFLALGCPYQSAIPLSPCDKALLDSRLAGTWISQPTETEQDRGTLIFYTFNEHEYVIDSSEEGESKHDIYRAYITKVGDSTFLNVQELNPNTTQRLWYFVNYIFTGDALSLRLVDEKIFTDKPTSSKSLYRFLKKNLNHKELYDGDPIVLKRAATPEP